jgi:hypothetical protein
VRWARAVAAASLCCVLASGCVTYLRFVNATPEDHPVLVFSGWRDGACRRTELYPLRQPGRVRLGRLLPARSECPAEIVAFRDAMGVVATPWPSVPTAGAGVERHDLQIRFPPMRRLPLALWILSDDHATPEWVEEQVRTANDLYAQLRVGVYLDTVVGRRTRSTALDAAFAQKCDGIAQLQASGLYDRRRVNAYFFLPENSSTLGRMCEGEGYPEAVFVASDRFPATLAHELGHVMGLLEPHGGDLYDVPGFRHEDCPTCDANLMIAGIDPVEDLTVGQNFRMSLDGRSWWNAFPTGGPIRPFPHMMKSCQTGETAPLTEDWPCPKLALREVPP